MDRKYYITLIFILNYNTITCLVGKYNSICYSQQRLVDSIPTGPDTTTEYISLKNIPICCPGYILNGENCEAVCAPGCINGNCTEPNDCDCFENYFGDLCDMKKCKPGYHGDHCLQQCPTNTYGLDCKGQCTCENGNCDSVTGKCECYDGWSGPTCSTKCNCLNGGKCNKNTECQCAAGFTGAFCEAICDETSWGPHCKNKCECEGNGCNEKTGECIASCAPEFYGKKCNKTCSCDKKGTEMCLRNTGKCICNPGFVGETCERLEVCPSMKFGSYCDNTCECVKEHSQGCNQATGECQCIPEWFGDKCDQRCKCENGYCNSPSGSCKCNPGWKGQFCNDKCSEGHYGQDCAQNCSLPDPYYYECNYVIGSICKPGFGGENCAQTCPEGTYGSGCLLCSCNQHTTKSCNRYTGDCECKPGWHGINCDKQCTSGSYGSNCGSSCKCPECRHTDGFCRCQDGWQGTICQEYCPPSHYSLALKECIEQNPLRYVRHEPTLKKQIIIMLIVGIVVLICILVLSAFYVRRRRKKRCKGTSVQLKTTATNGFETSNESETPEHHYEEIPYGYTGNEYNNLVHNEEPGYLPPKQASVRQNSPSLSYDDRKTQLQLNKYPSRAYNDDLLHSDQRLLDTYKFNNGSSAVQIRNPRKAEGLNRKVLHSSMDKPSSQRNHSTFSLGAEHMRYTPSPSHKRQKAASVR